MTKMLLMRELGKVEAKNPYDDPAVMSAYNHQEDDGKSRTYRLPSQEESEYDWKVQKLMFLTTLIGMVILAIIT